MHIAHADFFAFAFGLRVAKISFKNGAVALVELICIS